jgi:hypothetical protein
VGGLKECRSHTPSSSCASHPRNTKTATTINGSKTLLLPVLEVDQVCAHARIASFSRSRPLIVSTPKPLGCTRAACFFAL